MALHASPFLFFLLSSMAFISSVTSCDRCLHQSRASYFSSPSSVSDGACGYGSLALGINKGFIASAGPSIYRDGIGCGGCFQIRCKNAKFCSTKGVTVVVTDRHNANGTDFMLNTPAFLALANSGSAQTLKEARVADIEYRRVQCSYKNKNLSVQVDEGSQKPNNLTVKVLFQGGQTDMMGVDVARFGSSDWRFMTRSKTHGAAWTTNRAPTGPLQFRVFFPDSTIQDRISPEGREIEEESKGISSKCTQSAKETSIDSSDEHKHRRRKEPNWLFILEVVTGAIIFVFLVICSFLPMKDVNESHDF